MSEYCQNCKAVTDESDRLHTIKAELVAVLELVASEAYRLPSDCKRIITDAIDKAKRGEP